MGGDTQTCRRESKGESRVLGEEKGIVVHSKRGRRFARIGEGRNLYEREGRSFGKGKGRGIG